MTSFSLIDRASWNVLKDIKPSDKRSIFFAWSSTILLDLAAGLEPQIRITRWKLDLEGYRFIHENGL